jgi:uncharacterized protein (TIGR04255 family)
MGQKLRNAPVYFTIVQARFNPILALDTYAPKVQESLRKQGFPDVQKGMLTTFNLSLGSAREAPPTQVPVDQTTRYTFLNIERTAGFVLDQAALSFQTTEYDVFESFLAAFLAGLRTVHEVVDLSYTERLGVRYLDAVFPRTGETLSGYLNESLLGLLGKVEGHQLVHAFSETVGRAGSITVVSRAIVQDGPVGFPPDLQPMNLAVAERFRTRTGIHATLDIDGSYIQRERFDLDRVQKHLTDIHDQITRSFNVSVTQQALDVWR